MERINLPAGRNQERKLGFDMESLIGYLLLAGVLLSVALILTGMVWHWEATGKLQFDYSMPRMNLFEFILADFRRVASGLGPRRMIALGLAVLMLVPYLRVVASMLYFALAERDWKYTIFTGIVAAVLTYSLFLR